MLQVLRYNWESNKNPSMNNVDILRNPIARYIVNQTNLRTPRPLIIEQLLQQGHEYKDIKKAFSALKRHRNKRKSLDWRSPTAINETARVIRNDIRKKKISYLLGMTILIRARNMLKTMIKNPRLDYRLSQINKEIQITKRLLMRTYGNPDTARSYKVY